MTLLDVRGVGCVQHFTFEGKLSQPVAPEPELVHSSPLPEQPLCVVHEPDTPP